MKNVLFDRIYQKVFYLAEFFLKWREPKLIKGNGSFAKLPDTLKEEGVKNPIIITTKDLLDRGTLNPLLDALRASNSPYQLFDKVIPNPTIQNILDAYEMYKANNCDAIIAVGGGSAIDCAKGLGAHIVKPNKDIAKLGGALKINKKLPKIFAVPTTAGTGSECTVAAVISDERNARKIPLEDPVLIPYAAVLDPQLTVSLPPALTSTTGIDALSHAVEAYIGNANTKKTKSDAIKAITLIRDNLVTAYKDGTNLEARQNMQEAAYYAGLAFTRTNVGYVHAIAHSLGGKYHLPHGLAIAVTMPYVLEGYGKKAHKKLAELADLVNVTQKDQTDLEKANLFIEWLRTIYKEMNIQDKFPEIKEEDLNELVGNAYKEAIPAYPVPYIFSKEEFRSVYKKMMPEFKTELPNSESK